MRSASEASSIDARHRAAVRQAEKQHVHALERLSTHELQGRAPPQIGMGEVDELAVQTLAGDLRHVDLRMVEQQPQQFPAGVPRGADNGGGETIARCTPSRPTRLRRAKWR